MEQDTTNAPAVLAAKPKRKPNRRTVNLFLTMLPEEKQRLEDYAKESGRPITWIARDGIRAYLDTVEAKGELRPSKLSLKLSPAVPEIPRNPGRPPKPNKERKARK